MTTSLKAVSCRHAGCLSRSLSCASSMGCRLGWQDLSSTTLQRVCPRAFAPIVNGETLAFGAGQDFFMQISASSSSTSLNKHRGVF
jgi:hypothetical protein